MSTMYDALRKAEAERKKAAGVTETDSSSTEPMPEEGGMADNIKTVLLVVAVICVFGFGIYRFNAAKNHVNAPAKKVIAATNQQPTTALTPAVVAKAQRAPGTYGLDGVIDAGESSMAIINGKLLKPEQAIDHLILKKISPKEVELLNTKDNSTVILKI